MSAVVHRAPALVIGRLMDVRPVAIASALAAAFSVNGVGARPRPLFGPRV